MRRYITKNMCHLGMKTMKILNLQVFNVPRINEEEDASDYLVASVCVYL